MLSKHCHHREYYLLDRRSETVTFLKITKSEIENSTPVSFCYFEISGYVTNDILTGITYETNHTAFVNEQEHLRFMVSLTKAPENFDEELIMLLPLSVHPKFEDPF